MPRVNSNSGQHRMSPALIPLKMPTCRIPKKKFLHEMRKSVDSGSSEESSPPCSSAEPSPEVKGQPTGSPRLVKNESG